MVCLVLGWELKHYTATINGRKRRALRHIAELTSGSGSNLADSQPCLLHYMVCLVLGWELKHYTATINGRKRRALRHIAELTSGSGSNLADSQPCLLHYMVCLVLGWELKHYVSMPRDGCHDTMVVLSEQLADVTDVAYKTASERRSFMSAQRSAWGDL
ncbi:hypothetical protein J6590_045824 [Homalodisca vitripennis]|nr:hypothetical protein J6590_045824 [Homalodisca vitripennis]